jgi:phosphonate transport system substrate-binding protein
MLCMYGLLILSSHAWAAGALRIAPLPMENREATFKAFNPVVEYLQHQLGQSVELVYFDKNHEIVRAFKDKAIDIAMLGSLPYITLEKQGGKGEPLVLFREADGQASYRCVLVKAGSDPISLNTLRGKRIALTQPLSTCGYLGANAILRKEAGLSLESLQYYYLNTHEAAALAVVAGKADLAGVKEEFARKFANLGLVILAYSEPVPALGLFANQATLDDARIAEIRRVLLAAPESAYKTWGNSMHYGMIQPNRATFDSLRRLGDPAGIPGANAMNKAVGK